MKRAAEHHADEWNAGDLKQKKKREDKHDGKVYEGNNHGGPGGGNAADTGLWAKKKRSHPKPVFPARFKGYQLSVGGKENGGGGEERSILSVSAPAVGRRTAGGDLSGAGDEAPEPA